MRLLSLEGKLTALLSAALIAGIALTALLIRWWLPPWLAVLGACLALIPLAIVAARIATAPLTSLLRVLAGSVASFRDGDYSVSLAERRRDEFGDLIRTHNELGTVLRNQRQHLFQRELLLDTVVQNSPTALLLVDASEHVVYTNIAACALLNGGRRMTGLDFAAVVAECPPGLAAALAARQDGLFMTQQEGEEETYHLAQRDVRLHGKAHRLLQIRRLTRELSRQEVQTWKKVIRVISHELNNSLAPISSLAHSGRELAQRGDRVRLTTVFDTIEERTRHLDGFIRGYAEFAKLPQPRCEAVAWSAFLSQLTQHYPFHLSGATPDEPGWFDRTQLEQVLINLLKNAHESGSAADAIEIAIAPRGSETRIEVRDRGEGMSDVVLANALLPFYSTKRSGSGLGLALAREIVEAHGGRIALVSREGGGLTVALYLPRHVLN
jgi:two-component system, NtrC family, nitrogen regulation sensor histidine kinase NtrY